MHVVDVYSTECGKTEQQVYMAQLGDTFNMALLDTGCTQSVCGSSWLDIYLKTLDEDRLKGLKREKSDRSFKFGDGKIVHSIGKVILPIFLKGVRRNICVEVDIVNEELPLLLSKTSMKKSLTEIRFNGEGIEEVYMFGMKQVVHLSKNGHICIPISRYYIPDDNLVGELKNTGCQILLTGKTDNLVPAEKKKIARKLHVQFAHASSKKLIKLLRDGGIVDSELERLILEIEKGCIVCQKYKRADLRPAVCFPRSKQFNESLAIDLKVYLPFYMLHIIDHFTRFSRTIIIKNKKAETVVKGVLIAWIALFGSPTQILSDNGGEFDNVKFVEMCEKMNICVKTTAAESPWSNGVNERHNALLGAMVEKLLEEGHSLEDSACWATSAKNALADNKGYSPNQLLFGFNPNIPNVLNSSLPALEPCNYQDALYKTLTAMKDARKSYIQLEANERIQRAIKKKIRTNISSRNYEMGESVFFKRGTKWRGPGKIIGIDDKMLLIKQGGQLYRVSPCMCTRINEDPSDQNSENKVDNSEPSSIVNEDDTTVINNSPVVYDEIGQSDDGDVDLNMNNPVSEGEVVDRLSSDQSPIIETQLSEEISDSPPEQEFDASKPPPVKGLVECKFEDSSEWKRLRVVKRGGKVGGRNEKWFNVYDPNSEDASIFSVNWDQVAKWKNVPEEVLISTKNSDDPSVIEAKLTELDNWKKYNVYEEVDYNGQDFITVQWVLTQKYVDSSRVVKARLVARGFQEPNDHIKKDSPTASRESLRLLLSISSSFGWTMGSLDVKSAFLQGDNINRTVHLRPPKEANTDKLWRLNRCVYGLTDASRRWYLRVNNVLLDFGMEKVKLDEAVYIWTKDGELHGILCLHVDNLMWTGDDLFKSKVIEEFAQIFCISRNITRLFMFLGLQIKQFAGKVSMNQQHYIDNIEEPEIDLHNRKRDDVLSDEEKKIMERFCGQLAWAANLTRPDLSFDVCDASVGIQFSTIADVYKARKSLRKLRNTNISIEYVPMKHLENQTIVVHSDASHANLKGEGSQAGYVIFIVDKTGNANILKWQSKKISRVVKSSLAAETLSLLEAAETAFYLKQLFLNMLSKEGNNDLKIVCYTDNKSIVDHVEKCTKQVTDFRLRIDVSCLRDMLARKELDELVWISGSNQLADCFTKANASSAKLTEVLRTNKLFFA